MSDPAILVGSLIVGWVLTTMLVPRLAAMCHRRQWLDMPGRHKTHAKPTPRLTGVTLFAATWLPVVAVTLLWPEHVAEFRGQALPIFVGAVVVVVLGIVDDLRPLPGQVKLLVQGLVGVFLFANGIGFDRLWVPFVGGVGLGYLSLPVTLIWFLILTNAINIIDGLDGLAVSTTAIATLSLIWVSWTLRLPPIWVGAAGLLGGLVAFWRFNRAPARVFMGDSGSLSLGYFFAVVALLAPIKRFTVVAFFVPLFALFLPLAESLISAGRRSWKRSNPLHADTGHLHHRLLRAGWPPRRIVWAYGLVTGVFGAFSVLLSYGNHRLVALGVGIFVLLITVAMAIILRPWERAAGRASRMRNEE